MSEVNEVGHGVAVVAKHPTGTDARAMARPEGMALKPMQPESVGDSIAAGNDPILEITTPKNMGIVANDFSRQAHARRHAHGARRLRASFMLLGVTLMGSVAQAQSLPTLLVDSLNWHPSIAAQRAQNESAQQGVDAAKWQFFPTPSVSTERASASSNDTTYGHGDPQVTTLRIQQPLWTGGRLTAGLEKARAGVATTEAAIESARQDLALRVLQSYADWRGATLRAQAFQKSLDEHTRLREQIVRRMAQGISAASDLQLVQGRQEQISADLAVAQAQQATTVTRLSQLSGKPVTTESLQASVSVPLTLAPSVEPLMDQARTENPAVRRLLAQVSALEADIEERKAELSPEVYLRLERQYGNFSTVSDRPSNRIFIGLSTRFGAGLSSFSQVSAAQARYQSGLSDVESARLSLSEQIAADYVLAQSGQQRLSLMVASLRSSESISEAWNRQFLAGRKTWLDVMNAARELAQVETQIADLKSAQLLLTWRILITARGVDATVSDAPNLANTEFK